MFKSTILAGGMMLAALPAAAGIVYFDIDQTFVQGTGQSDLPMQTVPIGSLTSFVADPGYSSQYLDFMFPGSGTFATTDQQAGGYYFLRSYSDGDTIGATTFSSHVSTGSDWDTVLVGGSTLGVWNASHEGHLAFLSGAGQYGYITYDYTRIGGISTLTLKDGAYNATAGQHLMTPTAAVPIPFSAAFLAAGLAGLGALRGRRGAA